MPQRVGNIELYTGLKGVGGPNDQQLGAKPTRWAIGEWRRRGRSTNAAHVALVKVLVVRPGRGAHSLRLVRKVAPVALATIAVTLGLMIGR